MFYANFQSNAKIQVLKFKKGNFNFTRSWKVLHFLSTSCTLKFTNSLNFSKKFVFSEYDFNNFWTLYLVS